MDTFKMQYGDVYVIEECTISTADIDYEYVRNLTLDTDEDVYKERMKTCVSDGVSKRVLKNNKVVAFMYTLLKEYEGEGVSIWSNDSIGFILLLVGMFDNYPKRKIRFTPHNSDPTYMKSLVTGESIRNYYNHGTPLVCKVYDIKDRVESLYSRLRIV